MKKIESAVDGACPNIPLLVQEQAFDHVARQAAIIFFIVLEKLCRTSLQVEPVKAAALGAQPQVIILPDDELDECIFEGRLRCEFSKGPLARIEIEQPFIGGCPYPAISAFADGIDAVITAIFREPFRWTKGGKPPGI